MFGIDRAAKRAQTNANWVKLCQKSESYALTAKGFCWSGTFSIGLLGDFLKSVAWMVVAAGEKSEKKPQPGPVAKKLAVFVFGGELCLRRAVHLLSFVFLLGPLALTWAPETRNKTLPQ